jgi:hypothetical protein
LWYVQTIENIKPEVKILAAHGDYASPKPYPDENNFQQLFENFPIYIVSAVKGYCPDYVLNNYELADLKVLTKVIGKK